MLFVSRGRVAFLGFRDHFPEFLVELVEEARSHLGCMEMLG